MKWPAKRMQSQQGKGFGVYERAASLEAGGADVIHLEVGRPSFDTPQHIKDATKKALDEGIVHYGDLAGDSELREHLAAKLKADNGIPAEPGDIVVTTGLTQAAMAVFEAGLDPGDEVVMLEPFYPQHPPKIELVGGRVVGVPLVEAENWRLDADELGAAVGPKTTMICLVNPVNPVGRVLTRTELEDVADIAIANDLVVVTDEVYEYITYDGHEHISIASLDGMQDRTLSLFAFTKAYAMDGWRMGYAVGPPQMIADVKRITMNQTTHPNVFAQKGAIAAVAGGRGVVDEMVAEDRRRRDLLCSRLNAIEGIECPVPEATIYAFPNVSGLGLSSSELVTALLERGHVAVEDGGFYGPAGDGHLRICFGSEPYERLVEAVDRIEEVVEQIR